MRAVSKRLFTILNSTEFDPVQLLDIQLVGQAPISTLRLTDAQYTLTWNGNDYAPISMQRGTLEERMATQAGEVPAVTMTITNVDRQMARLLGQAEVEGATATLRLCDRRLLTNPRDAVVLTVGEVRSLSLSEATLTFQIVSILGQQERITIPRRIFQANCNYIFGSMPHCGVNINTSPITILTEIQDGTTDKYVVLPSSVLTDAGNPADPTDFWDTGYIVMLRGQAGLQSRPIQRVETFNGELRFYLRFKMLEAPLTGDAVAVRRNCRRTKADCAMYHDGDPSQYGGFTEVPPPRFKPTKSTLSPDTKT